MSESEAKKRWVIEAALTVAGIMVGVIGIIVVVALWYLSFQPPFRLMSFWETIHLITAVAALGTAIATLIVGLAGIGTLIAVWKHNSNSLKPRCSILVTNYENFISVSIENNGTGPVIIKNVEFDPNPYKQSLLEMMADIDQAQFYRIADTTQEYSVAPNSRMYLLAINPRDDDEVRRKIRGKLKNLKITVLYTDIGEKYHGLSTCKDLEVFNSDQSYKLESVAMYLKLTR